MLTSCTPNLRPSRGSVKMVYETAEGEEVHFSRTIQPSGAGGDVYQSVYRINERTVSLEQYNESLR